MRTVPFESQRSLGQLGGDAQAALLGRVKQDFNRTDHAIGAATIDQLPAASSHALALHRVGQQDLDGLFECVRREVLGHSQIRRHAFIV